MVPSDADDKELVARSKSGDLTAFSELVRRYEPRLWGFLSTWVRDPGDREEVVQEVFLAAYEGIGKFRGDARFSTWLFQIAVNMARGRRRRAARRPTPVELEAGEAGDRQLHDAELESTPVAPSRPDPPDEAVVHDDLVERLWSLVEELPESWRDALRLRYLEEMTYAEVAEVLDAPVGTVKVWVHRARKELAERVRGEGWA